MTFVTREELAREEVELLPSRETLAFFNWANVSATNVARRAEHVHPVQRRRRLGEPGRSGLAVLTTSPYTATSSRSDRPVTRPL